MKMKWKTLGLVGTVIAALGLTGCDENKRRVEESCEVDINKIKIVYHQKCADMDKRMIQLYKDNTLNGEITYQLLGSNLENAWFQCNDGSILRIDENDDISYDPEN